MHRRSVGLAGADIVIADNLASHKVAGVRQAIKARGASLWFLRPYSPDQNPIEQAFATAQAVRSFAARVPERERHCGPPLALLSAASHKPNARTSSPTQATTHTQCDSALLMCATQGAQSPGAPSLLHQARRISFRSPTLMVMPRGRESLTNAADHLI